MYHARFAAPLSHNHGFLNDECYLAAVYAILNVGRSEASRSCGRQYVGIGMLSLYVDPDDDICVETLDISKSIGVHQPTWKEKAIFSCGNWEEGTGRARRREEGPLTKVKTIR